MKLLGFLVLCAVLFVWSPPVALAVLILLPLLWLFSLPIRLLLLVVEAIFALLKAILFLPARLLGYRG